MNRVCSIFSQILRFVPRLEFEAAVEKAEHRQHGFASWDQFGAMMFCQLGQVAILKKRLALDATLYQILQILSVIFFEKTPILRAFDDQDSQENQPHF